MTRSTPDRSRKRDGLGVIDSVSQFTSYCSALLHMNGADGSTTFTDETGKVWTTRGNAQIDTAQSKFGGASGLFDGTTDWIDTPSHDDFDFGSGDFALDGWFRFSSLAALRALFAKRANSGVFAPFVAAVDSTNVYFLCSANGSSWGVNIQWAHGGAVAINTWYHMLFRRSGSDWRFYLDGVSKASATVSQTLMTNATVVSIGAYADGSNGMAGWVDEARISKGTPRQTVDFTPPTEEYFLD